MKDCYAIPQESQPIADVITGEWVPTPVYSQINDPYPGDSTFVSSSGLPQGDTFEVRLKPLDAPEDGNQILKVRMRKLGSGVEWAWISLLQAREPLSPLLIATRRVDPTNLFEDYSLVLTLEEAKQISNYASLLLRVTTLRDQSSSSSTSISGSESSSSGSSVSESSSDISSTSGSNTSNTSISDSASTSSVGSSNSDASGSETSTSESSVSGSSFSNSSASSTSFSDSYSQNSSSSSSSSSSSNNSSSSSSFSNNFSGSSTSGSSSSTSAISACGFTAVAFRYSFSISGVSNGSCGNCGEYNQTYVLIWNSFGYWISDPLSNPCGEGGTYPQMRCVGSDMIIDWVGPGQVVYKCAKVYFDPLGSTIFVGEEIPGIPCTNWPATIRVMAL